MCFITAPRSPAFSPFSMMQHRCLEHISERSSLQSSSEGNKSDHPFCCGSVSESSRPLGDDVSLMSFLLNMKCWLIDCLTEWLIDWLIERLWLQKSPVCWKMYREKRKGPRDRLIQFCTWTLRGWAQPCVSKPTSVRCQTDASCEELPVQHAPLAPPSSLHAPF